jgi:DNA-binding response OmpR family regulator
MATILIAKNKKDLCGYICGELGMQGHDVTPAYNGETALEEIRKQVFDMVITDYQMPKIKGDVIALTAQQSGVPHVIINSPDAKLHPLKGIEIVQNLSIDQIRKRVKELFPEK